jgi:hypothetical protein
MLLAPEASILNMKSYTATVAEPHASHAAINVKRLQKCASRQLVANRRRRRTNLTVEIMLH